MGTDVRLSDGFEPLMALMGTDAWVGRPVSRIPYPISHIRGGAAPSHIRGGAAPSHILYPVSRIRGEAAPPFQKNDNL